MRISAVSALCSKRVTLRNGMSKLHDCGSWKVGDEWALIQSLRLRAMAQKATRAPTINELFASVVTSLSNLAVDPCQGNRVNQAASNVAGRCRRRARSPTRQAATWRARQSKRKPGPSASCGNRC